MNYRQFQDTWYERFDNAAPSEATSSDRELHALACPECARLAVGFRLLHQAIEAAPRPVVPADFRDRVLASLPARTAQRGWSGRSRAIAWTASIAGLAAALLVAVAIFKTGPGIARDREVKAADARDPGMLSIAVAQVTSAGLDLARETSAPAARIGLGVIDSARESEILATGADGPDRVGDVLEIVGRRLGDEVRPLSGSARRAFSFLALPSSHARPVRAGGG